MNGYSKNYMNWKAIEWRLSYRKHPDIVVWAKDLEEAILKTNYLYYPVEVWFLDGGWTPCTQEGIRRSVEALRQRKRGAIAA
jgi:hypothetical protein